METETEEQLKQQPISEKEDRTRNLESLPDLESKQSITLELGDIIEIVAPTNPEIHESTFLIQYIDNEKIHIINVSSSKRYLLSIVFIKKVKLLLFHLF
jgi:sucrose-6-phosphate hydrolase SacC (GH32 family)